MNWYAFLVGAGASLAIWRIVQGQKKQVDFQWSLAGLWVLGGSWLGAKLAYFIWHPAAIVDFGWQVIGLREGGMVWSGAVFGAWITIFILALAKRTKWLVVADRLLVMLPPLAIMAWLAGWISGSGYGPVMQAAWWVPRTLDDNFQLSPRFPLQWMAATSLFLVFLLLEPRFPKDKTGGQAALNWLIFTIHTLIFSFLRADHRPESLGLYWDIWFGFICLLWAIVLIWLIYKRKPVTEIIPD
ncbi:MAG: prolipoprotein diacylglyceryl transferase [Anaerolineaceae bacterium]|nr:prolipoprotein diacylglyceryl transferase [Anaerolineaceae bacterium]